MQARQSYVSVKYNGKDITKKITDFTEGFEYVDNASGTADTVSLKLNNRSGVCGAAGSLFRATMWKLPSRQRTGTKKATIEA